MNRYRVHVRRGGAYIVDRCTGERFFWRHDAELVRSVARDLNASARAPGAERFVYDRRGAPVGRMSHAG